MCILLEHTVSENAKKILPWVSVPSLFRHGPEIRGPYLRRGERKMGVLVGIIPTQTKNHAIVRILCSHRNTNMTPFGHDILTTSIFIHYIIGSQ